MLNSWNFLAAVLACGTDVAIQRLIVAKICLKTVDIMTRGGDR
jgi:hypothetical protein